MKKIILTIISGLGVSAMFAQAPEDVLRYSFFPQHGSARTMAIGGAMGSLGGDINALYVNPAGLGFYKTQEVIFSPALMLNNNKFSYLGTDSINKKSGFDLGTIGFVGGYGTSDKKWRSQAVSFAINQTANFNNTFSYKGFNRSSSYTEQFTEEISGSGLSIDGVLNNSKYAFGSAPALYTYLVDTFRTSPNTLVLKGLPEFLLAKGMALAQQKTIATKGGIYEIALGYAANMDDKLYLGGSIGIPIVSYTRNTTYRESDTSADHNNNFDFFELKDDFRTFGFGVNAKLGVIYKPQEYIRLGFALHTPTFYNFTDHQSAQITANTEAYNSNKTAVAASSIFTGGKEGQAKYQATSPWKAIVSASYVFREINDTRKQRAFITGDIEYVGYPSSRFSSSEENPTAEDEVYYDDLKSVIKDYYKGAFNFRLGGELKFHTIMVRLGGAYYGNPYDNSTKLKASRTQASGGLGYRNHGVFIDLSYVHTFNRDVDFPYRLSDKPNIYAEQRGSRGNVVATVGFKF